MPTIHIAGDSTAAEKDENKRPETGWGEKISAYFSPEIQINNQAKNGRSTKSFIQEGRLARLASQFQPNDFLFVQFGHNDQKIQEERGTLPFGSYLKNLQIFFECAKKSERPHGLADICDATRLLRKWNIESRYTWRLSKSDACIC